MKQKLSTEEVYDRLKEEIEVVSDCAEGHVEDAAYRWTRIIGSKAEVVGETLQVKIGPFEIRQLLSSLLEERLDECRGDPERLAGLWTQICPHEAQVGGNGLLVEEDV